MIEELCRVICKAENVDPDKESVGSGGIMPIGKPYKLWEARIIVAEALEQWILANTKDITTTSTNV